MRKLISIGLIISLLVTFLVPAAVGAQAQYPADTECNNCTACGPDAPCPARPPTQCVTKSAGGAVLWSLLATTYIMGRAVGDVTETLAGTLGCYVDRLALPLGGAIAAVFTGLGGLLKGLGGLLEMEDIFDPIGTMLEEIEDLIKSFIEE